MALGRGLGAILDEVGQAYDNEIADFKQGQGEVKEIPLSDISPNPYQPRKYFDQTALSELSESIKRHGLLQPIVVVKRGDGEGYLLVAGERRLRAHELAKIEKIKAIVADVDIDELKLRELALIENIQREDLNAIELAHSYDELIKVYEITHDKLSEFVNKSRSQITNTLRLLSLSQYAQEALINGMISQGHAKVLVGLEESIQRRLVDTIVGQKLSVREAEQLVKSNKTVGLDENKPLKVESTFLSNYEDKLSSKLPFVFKAKQNTLEIKFKSDEEVKKFLSMLD